MLDLNYEYSISEVSEITGYAAHVLRYYEKEFEINVPRNNSNHRYYTYKEIELLQYIKTLQEKGFGNKQIKLIINSPEVVMNIKEDKDLVVVNDNKCFDSYQLAKEISTALEEDFFDKLFDRINKGSEKNVKLIEELRDEILMLKNQLNSKERDILICENAKLKMKVKEKTFENIELKGKIKRIESNQEGFFKKIFKHKSKNV